MEEFLRITSQFRRQLELSQESSNTSPSYHESVGCGGVVSDSDELESDTIKSNFVYLRDVMNFKNMKLNFDNQVILKENENLKSRNESLLTKIFETKELLTQGRDELKLEKESSRKINQDRDRISAELKCAIKNSQVISAENSYLKTQLFISQDKLSKSKEETVGIENELKSSHTTCENFKAEIKSFEAKTQKLKEELHALQELMSQERSKSLLLESKISTFDKLLEHTNNKISRLDSRLLTQSQLVHSLSEEKLNLHKVIGDLEIQATKQAELIDMCKVTQQITIKRFDNIVASKEREIAELRGQQNTSGSNNRLGLKGITDISSVREGPESSGDLNYAKGKGQSQLLTTEVSTMTEHNSSSDSNCYAQTITPVSMKCTTSEQKRRRCSQEQVGMRAKMTTTVENSNVQVAQDIVKTIKTLIFDSGMCPVCGEAPCGMMVTCAACRRELHSACARKNRQKTGDSSECETARKSSLIVGRFECSECISIQQSETAIGVDSSLTATSLEAGDRLQSEIETTDV